MRNLRLQRTAPFKYAELAAIGYYGGDQVGNSSEAGLLVRLI